MIEPEQWSMPRRLELSRSIARVLLYALAFSLPFEAPLFPLGPLVVTSVELMLYLSIIGWFVSLAVTVGGSWTSAAAHARTAVTEAARDPVASAVAVWLVVTAISAAFAPSYRTAALKFALRTLSGGLLFFAARDVVRSLFHARRLVVILLAGATLSAALTFLEAARPEWTAWWRPFRTREFTAGDLVRASGTFAFPNIAAMYWEASIPLTLAVLMVGSDGTRLPRRRGMILGMVLAGLLVHGILATASRAAMGGAVLSAGMLLLFGGSPGASGQAVRQIAVAILAVEIVLVAATLSYAGVESPAAQRLVWWRAAAHSELVAAEGPSVADSPLRDLTALTTRKELWAAAVQLWLNRPILGVGPDNFRHRYPAVITTARGRHLDDERLHANNLYLETLADLGLMGALALLLLIFSVLRAARINLRYGASPLELGLIVAVVTFLVHGCVDYFFEFTPTFGLWWLLLALLSKPTQPSGATPMTIAPG
jgi:O-antigen ligase